MRCLVFIPVTTIILTHALFSVVIAYAASAREMALRVDVAWEWLYKKEIEGYAKNHFAKKNVM